MCRLPPLSTRAQRTALRCAVVPAAVPAGLQVVYFEAASHNYVNISAGTLANSSLPALAGTLIVSVELSSMTTVVRALHRAAHGHGMAWHAQHTHRGGARDACMHGCMASTVQYAAMFASPIMLPCCAAHAAGAHAWRALCHALPCVVRAACCGLHGAWCVMRAA